MVCQFQNGKVLFCSSTGVQMSSQNIHSIFGPSYLFEGLGVYRLMRHSFSGLSLHLSIPLQFCHNVITTLTISIPYFFSIIFFSEPYPHFITPCHYFNPYIKSQQYHQFIMTVTILWQAYHLFVMTLSLPCHVTILCHLNYSYVPYSSPVSGT